MRIMTYEEYIYLSISSTRPYKNGKTFEDCKADARKTLQPYQTRRSNSQISWDRILEVVDHDESLQANPKVPQGNGV